MSNSRHHHLLIDRLSPPNSNEGARHIRIERKNPFSLRGICAPPTRSPPLPPRQSKPATPQFTSKVLRSETRATQLPLSIYEFPTATYMWPRWKPDAESRTHLFVRYKAHSSESDSVSTYSTSYSCPDSPVLRMTISPHNSPVSTPPPLAYSRKRSSSAESDDDSVPSPSDRFLKLPRVSYDHEHSREKATRSATPNVTTICPTHSQDKEEAIVAFPLSFGESDVSDVELRPATFYPSNSSRGEELCLRSTMPIAGSPAPARTALREESEECDNDQKKEWIKYTFPSPDTSVGPEFCCTWQERQRDGTSEPCGYRSKKHLVKRHIESKHLQLRPCKCSFCGKGFSQKSNLDTHLNTHTNNAPHKCHYCDDHFKDPARRHRHMIQAHRHVSSRTKRGRLGIDVRAGSVPEASTHQR